MSDEGASRRTGGRPMVWLGIVWVALGVVWLAMALADPSWFRALMALFWLVAGAIMTTVGLRDGRLGLVRSRR